MYDFLKLLQVMIVLMGFLALWACLSLMFKGKHPVLALFSFLVVLVVTAGMFLPTVVARNHLVREKAQKQRAEIERVCGPHAARLFVLWVEDEEEAHWSLYQSAVRKHYQKILLSPACTHPARKHAGPQRIRPHDPMGELPRWEERRP